MESFLGSVFLSCYSVVVDVKRLHAICHEIVRYESFRMYALVLPISVLKTPLLKNDVRNV